MKFELKIRLFSPPTTCPLNTTLTASSSTKLQGKEHLCIYFSNFPPVTSSLYHPLLHIAKSLTHAQSQFPVRKLTPFIGYNMDRAEYIIMGALTFMIKSLSYIFQTAGPVPVWQQRNSL